MIETIQTTNYILALGGIVIFLLSTLFVVDLYTSKSLKPLISRWWLCLALATTFGSSMMTLVYSEIFGLVPCGLCWLGRLFLFPQVFLLATALYYKDKMFARYGIVLSSLGFCVSLYHHYIQMGGSEFIKCPASGASCTQRFLFEFNFITFPLLSAGLFFFLIVLYYYVLKVGSD